MSRTFEQTKAGYTHMWNNASLMASKKAMAVAAATKICSKGYKDAFMAVQAATGMAWWFIGALLYRESDINLNTYLGNGQSLLHKTTEVPANRGPFIGSDGKGDFVAGAIDAIRVQGWLNKYKLSDFTIELGLYLSEEFNGEGYENVNVNDPYVWAGTNWEQGGLFVADHQLDRNAHDTRVGVAAIYACIAAIDPSILQPPTVSAQPQEKPMVTPTPTPPVATTANPDLVRLTKFLETVVSEVPIIAQIPFLGATVAPAVPFVPVAEVILQAVEEAEAATSLMDVVNVVEKHFAQISAAITAAKAQMGVK